MPSSMFDQWSQSQKVSFAPIMELNSITTRLCGELLRQNLLAMNEFAQSSQEQLQGLTHVKGIDGALQAQTQWLAKATPQVLKHAEGMLDTVLTSATEYQTWFEHNLETMKQEGKTMTEKFTPKVK